MSVSISADPVATVSRHPDTDLLNIEVDLGFFDEEMESAVEAALSGSLSSVSSEASSRLGVRKQSGQICVACMDVTLSRKTRAYSAEEMRSEADRFLLEFDAISSTGPNMCHQLSTKFPGPLLEEAMSASDDMHIGQLGVIEWVHALPGLYLPDVMPALISALSPLTGVFNGIVLIGEVEMDLSSNHKRLHANKTIQAFSVTHTDDEMNLTIRTSGGEDENTLLLCGGLFNPGGLVPSKTLRWMD
jgi:hypothetical protein